MATTHAELATVLRLERTVDAPPEQVYEAWTNETMIKKWHAPGDHVVALADVDVRPGGRYRIAMKAPKSDVVNIVKGVYVEVRRPSRLVYTWRWENDTDNMGETLVTVTFTPVGHRTRIEILHERFPTGELRDKHGHGWSGCLDHLACVMNLYRCMQRTDSDTLAGPAVAYYLQQTGFASMVRNDHILPGVSDEDSLWQPAPGRPPIAWHVAHIACSEAAIVLGMCKGDWDRIDPAWIPRYRMGAKLDDVLDELPPLSVILPETERMRRECETYLRSITDDALHAPMPDRRADMCPEFMVTPMDALRSLPIHEAHHNGEMALIKKLLGNRAA